MKNLKLLTIAVVLAELMVVKHNVMAAEQDGTPMARKARAARRGGLMAFRRAVQERQKSKQELTVAQQEAIDQAERATEQEARAIEEGKRADTAEMETLRVKIVSKIKETASLNAKRVIDKTADELLEVVNNLDEKLKKEGKKGLTIDGKIYDIESVQDILFLMQDKITAVAESAIRAVAIEKQAFDQAEKTEKTTAEEGWNGITFPAELKNQIEGMDTKASLETYLENLTEKNEFVEYQNKLKEKGISYFWRALLNDSLGIEQTEINPINEANCLKVIGQGVDAMEQDVAYVPLSFGDSDSDNPEGGQGGVGGALNKMGF